MLESLRLWPTKVHSGFLHRDDQALPYADRFAPEIWLDGCCW